MFITIGARYGWTPVQSSNELRSYCNVVDTRVGTQFEGNEIYSKVCLIKILLNRYCKYGWQNNFLSVSLETDKSIPWV